MFLTVTGGEALYADMGSFGKGPVRLAWFGLVWPSLLLSYFGQGALVLTDAAAAHKPLFALVPVIMLPWMVLLATLAAIIASQATITGAFSVTRQAVQLDLLPRMRILQTSAHEHGQVFVPVVNVLVFCRGVRVRRRLWLLRRARRHLRRRRGRAPCASTPC